MKSNTFLLLAIVLLFSCNHPADYQDKSLLTYDSLWKVQKLKTFLFSEDSLIEDKKKYSYYVDLNSKKPDHATGFFIKFKMKKYFVSAYHVFTSQDVTNKKRLSNSWDKLSIRYTSSENKSSKFYIIDLKSIIKHSPFIDNNKTPDFYIYEIKDLPNDFMPNYIELNQSDGSQNYDQSSNMFVWGFPGKQFTPYPNYNELTSYLICGTYNIDGLTLGEKPKPAPQFIGTFLPGGYGGMSGSPVFGKYRNSLNAEHVKLSGIYFANPKFPNGVSLSCFVKISELLKKLQ